MYIEEYKQNSWTFSHISGIALQSLSTSQDFFPKMPVQRAPTCPPIHPQIYGKELLPGLSSTLTFAEQRSKSFSF